MRSVDTSLGTFADRFLPGSRADVVILESKNWALFDEESLNAVNATAAQQQGYIELLEAQVKAVFGRTQKFDRLCERVERIEGMLGTVLKTLTQTIGPKQSIVIPIQSLAPEPYEILQPFSAVVIPGEGGFEAGFFDAEIFASGDTEEEAVWNLKSTIIDTYDRLSELSDAHLGPGPARQKQILSAYIRKKQP